MMMVMGIATIVLGALIAATGAAKVDRRFKTGYRDNVGPDRARIKLGGVVILVGALVVTAAVTISWIESYIAESAREMASARPELATVDLGARER